MSRNGSRVPRNALVGCLLLGVVGCDDPCGELEDQCGDCPGTDTTSQAIEDACNAIVRIDDDDACDVALDSRAYKCP